MTFQARNENGNKLTEAVTRGGGEARRLVNEVLPSIDTKVLAAKVEAPTLSKVFEVKAATAEPERREQRKNPAVYQKGEGWLHFGKWFFARLPFWIANTFLYLGGTMLFAAATFALVFGVVGAAGLAVFGTAAWAFHGFALSYISLPWIAQFLVDALLLGAGFGALGTILNPQMGEAFGQPVDDFLSKDKFVG